MNIKQPFVSILVITWNRKKDVIKCLNSLKEIIYPYTEIILIDDNSTDGTKEEVESKFSDIKIVKNKRCLMAAGSRNEGIRLAKGDFLFFIDSDNIVDTNVISELINVFSKDISVGIAGPKMYYFNDPKRIWFAGADINLLTSKTTYIGYNVVDYGQFDQVRETGHFPNAFMIRKKVFDKIDVFDDNFVMHYEESDLCMRAKKAGFKVLFVPTAIVWHNVPLPSELKNSSRGLGLDNTVRTYFTARNRLIFMKKHAKSSSYLIFIIIFLPIFTIYYLYILYSRHNIDLATSYLKGVFDGLKYTFKTGN